MLNVDDLSQQARDVHERIEQMFTCLVCMSCHPHEATQCTNGHVVCNICSQKLTSCPMCRDGVALWPSALTKRVASEIDLSYTCPYGCGERIRHSYRTAHISTCIMHKASCPVCQTFHDSLGELLKHVKEQHDEEYFEIQNPTLRCVENVFLTHTSLFLATTGSFVHVNISRDRHFGTSLTFTNLHVARNVGVVFSYESDGVQHQSTFVLVDNIKRTPRSLRVDASILNLQNVSLIFVPDVEKP